MQRVEDAKHEICIYCHEEFNVSKEQYIPRSGYACRCVKEKEPTECESDRLREKLS